MESIFLVLSLVSIVVMFFALYQAFVLKKKVPGGKVKETWDFLAGLIVLFFAGYLSTPFFRMLPPEIKDVLVGVIFLAGAVFVLIVVKLLYKIVEDLGL
ncbi:MAG: hypothetical protein A2010_15585 [Nitrospirae bacterium GWD2_57_9]|nr:MAG: hypothetical protein A2010_15585 [Nitrospirae bacterium GWD2_57_9]OGW48120.1 MAG: hypothetical protein A2078_00670 [Nitrospirae bacterium GWC2_57_9]